MGRQTALTGGPLGGCLLPRRSAGTRSSRLGLLVPGKENSGWKGGPGFSGNSIMNHTLLALPRRRQPPPPPPQQQQPCAGGEQLTLSKMLALLQELQQQQLQGAGRQAQQRRWAALLGSGTMPGSGRHGMQVSGLCSPRADLGREGSVV